MGALRIRKEAAIGGSLPKKIKDVQKESLYKRIIKTAGIYSIAVAAGRMASFLLLPVYTRYLSPADYGVLELLELTSFIFSALIGMRIGDALFYYYAKANTPELKQQAVCTVFLGAGLLGAVGGTVGVALSPVLSKMVFGSEIYAAYFRMVFLTFSFSLSVEAGFCYLRALDRPVSYVGASIARLVVGIVLNVTLLMSGLGIYAVLWSSLLTTAAMAVYLGGSALSGVRLQERFSRPLLFQFVRYSAPLGISGLSMFVINYGDRFFLQKFATLEEIGIYSLAYKLGMLITYIQTPFDVYWRSQMFSLVRKPNGDILFVRVATYLALGLAFVVLLFSLFTGPVLQWMVPSTFWGAAQYVPWIAAAYVIRTVGAHFRCVFLLEGQTSKEVQVTAVGTLTCLAGYSILIPRYRVWGAVASTVAGFAAMFAVGLWQAQKVRRYAYEYGRLAAVGVTTTALIVLFVFAKPQNPFLQIGLGMVLAGVYPLVLLWLGFADDEERNLLGKLAGVVQRKVSQVRMLGERA